MLYSHIRAEPYLCVPACLSMLLRRRGFHPSTQISLAEVLGLTIPESLSVKYPFAEISEDPSSWGVPVHGLISKINQVLASYDRNLVHRHVMWNEIPNGEHLEFLADELGSGADIAVGFLAGTVYDGAPPVGHLALISELLPNEQVLLTDPEQGGAVGVRVDWSKLFSGIRDRNDGFWLFEHTHD